MDLLTIYSYVLGGLLLALWALGLIRKLPLRKFYAKHFLLPFLFRRRRWWLQPITRAEALLLVLHWGCTLTCNVVAVDDLRHAGSRAGSLAIAHFIPLYLGNRPSLAADTLGISLLGYQRLHRAVGWMAFVQGTVHAIIATKTTGLNLKDVAQRYGLAATLVFSTLVLLSHSFFRRTSYDQFLIYHSALAVAGMVLVWLHLKKKIRLPLDNDIVVLITAAFLMVAFLIYRARIILYRNRLGQLPKATVVQYKGSTSFLKISIKGTRGWELAPGQYVYVSFPAASSLRILADKPFCVLQSPNPMGDRNTPCETAARQRYPEAGDLEQISTWVDEETEESGDEQEGIENENAFRFWLLISQRRGLTRNLADFKKSQELLAIVEGPYGRTPDLKRYSHILMIGSGVGIAALIPYLRAFLHGAISGELPVKEVHAICDVDDKSKRLQYERKKLANGCKMTPYP
ncbi:uncharacterized protein GIQ15_03619 [Arthroderma uncinatum]|uniref:uncharacterized protein n=1 Tax=Arthroderma uncinatum TaxID=74035 RepID=UPI00144A78E8|nr:uncharacterized protein GIQ15_03619 [Arthroderma uncinatum]KAF3484295.1 hypothetical protein GIQ15_03619 [Arthroderma uncinatum]